MSGAKGGKWGVNVYLDPSIPVGAIPYKGAGGVLLWLTPGAASQVITSNGVSPAIPSYQAGGGGGGGSGAETLISEQALGVAAASVNFTSIPATYRDLRLVVRGRSSNASDNVALMVRLNGDTGANYDWFVDYSNMTATQTGTGALVVTAPQMGWLNGDSAQAGAAGITDCMIYDYRGTTFHKTMIAGAALTSSTAAPNNIGEFGGRWRSLAVVNQVTAYPSLGNLMAGTVVSLYGRM